MNTPPRIRQRDRMQLMQALRRLCSASPPTRTGSRGLTTATGTPEGMLASSAAWAILQTQYWYFLLLNEDHPFLTRH